MKRWIGVVAALAAAATIGLGAGVAHANTCNTVSVASPIVGNDYVESNGVSGATCAARWYVFTAYQFETGGQWHDPNAGGNQFHLFEDGGSDMCYPGGAASEAYCWGTSNGSGSGYFGSGDARSWHNYYLAENGVWADPQCYNWRQLVILLDYATSQEIGNNHYSPQVNATC